MNDDITQRNIRRYRTEKMGARDFDDQRQRGGLLPSRQAADRGFACAELCGQAGYEFVPFRHMEFRHPTLGTFRISRPTLERYRLEYVGAPDGVEYPDLPTLVADLRARGLATTNTEE